MAQLKIDIVIYDPQKNKLEEMWSHNTFKINDIREMMEQIDEAKPRTRRNRCLTFESFDACLKYKLDFDLPEDPADVECAQDPTE